MAMTGTKLSRWITWIDGGDRFAVAIGRREIRTRVVGLRSGKFDGD